MTDWIAGFTFEGFYTRLNDAFFLQPIGEDEFGERFEKQNGIGATVQGITLEIRANLKKQWQFEGGITIQQSQYDNAVQYIDNLAGERDFIRTPNEYGYAILSFSPSKRWSSSLNYVYTGAMRVPHFAGAPNQLTDDIITTNSFSELSAKLSHIKVIESLNSELELYAGVKNIFNNYQEDFDIGKNRDSNFIYGPALPRTLFVGIKLKSQ